MNLVFVVRHREAGTGKPSVSRPSVCVQPQVPHPPSQATHRTLLPVLFFTDHAGAPFGVKAIINLPATHTRLMMDGWMDGFGKLWYRLYL